MAKKAKKEIQIGDKMPDGSIYAGLSPDTKRPMYVAAKDAPMCMDFNKAAKYAKKLDVHGHKDWRVPTKGELNVLFQNREKGALQKTFNLTGSSLDGWYWSSTSETDECDPTIHSCVWMQRFSNGKQVNVYSDRNDVASVRCVRS